MGQNDSPDPMLQWFRYAHLPENLRAISQRFAFLAQQIVDELPRNPERTVALRKLLEAKDCAVRAVIYEPAGAPVEEKTSAEASRG